jgi:phage gp36-like protein
VTFATLQGLQERFGAAQVNLLADHNGDGSPDTGPVDRALADADALVSSYLRGRYALPFATTPAQVVAVAHDVAFYNLHTSDIPDDVIRRYEQALAWLRHVADGKAVLEVAGVAPAVGAGGDLVMVAASDRIFTADTLRGFS